MTPSNSILIAKWIISRFIRHNYMYSSLRNPIPTIYVVYCIYCIYWMNNSPK